MRKKAVISNKIKAKVALEAIKEHLTTSEIGRKYQVHPVQVGKWRKKLLEGAPEVFDSDSSKTANDEQDTISKLYEQIGRLQVENDRMKLYKNSSSHPYSALARGLLVKAITSALQKNDITPEELRQLSDRELLYRLDEIQNNDLVKIIEDGVDEHYKVLTSFTLDRIEDGKSDYFQLAVENSLTQFQKDIINLENKYKITNGSIQSVVTYDYSKTGKNGVKVPILSDDQSNVVYQNMEFRVNRRDRFVAIFISKEIDEDKSSKIMDEIATILTSDKLKVGTQFFETSRAITRPVIDLDLLNNNHYLKK